LERGEEENLVPERFDTAGFNGAAVLSNGSIQK
jgi:hypothetical protein